MEHSSTAVRTYVQLSSLPPLLHLLHGVVTFSCPYALALPFLATPLHFFV